MGYKSGWRWDVCCLPTPSPSLTTPLRVLFGSADVSCRVPYVQNNTCSSCLENATNKLLSIQNNTNPLHNCDQQQWPTIPHNHIRRRRLRDRAKREQSGAGCRRWRGKLAQGWHRKHDGRVVWWDLGCGCCYGAALMLQGKSPEAGEIEVPVRDGKGKLICCF